MPHVKTCAYCSAVFETRNRNREYCSRTCSNRSRNACVDKLCQRCGSSFVVQAYRADTAAFCSRACADGTRVSRVCETCSATFVVSASRATQARFCSYDCSNIGRRKRIQYTCPECECAFEKAPSRSQGVVTYCSAACAYKARVGAFGAANPMWKGGKSFEPYPPTFNKQFKKLIRERDNYTCAICRIAFQRGLSVHHINYVKDDTTPTNCISLCGSCHAATNNNRVYWEQALKRLLQRRTGTPP